MKNKPQLAVMIVLFGLLGLAIYIFIGNQSGKKIPTNEITKIGIIRTAGLSDEEKQKNDIASVQFQLTDFGRNEASQNLQGFYLLANNKSIETLVGACVAVTGTIPLEWKNKSQNDPYNRSVLRITKIEKLDNSKCNPYAQASAGDTGESKKLTFRGAIKRATRVSPDINYDYQIQLKEPYLDNTSASGSPQETSSFDIIPSTNETWISLENNINKEVEITGYLAWGYAESKYIDIVSINPIP